MGLERHVVLYKCPFQGRPFVGKFCALLGSSCFRNHGPCSSFLKAASVSVEMQEIEGKAKARKDEEISDHIESDLSSFGPLLFVVIEISVFKYTIYCT